MRTPKPGDVDRGTIQSWNVAYERRLPLDIAVDVAYVGATGRRRLHVPRHQRATDDRRRQQQPAVCEHGPLPRSDQLRERARDSLSVPAGRDQQAVHRWPADQGRVHPLEGREHGGRRRRRRELQLAGRVSPQHGVSGLRSDAQLPRRRRLSAAVAERRRASRQHRPRHHQRLAAQRHVRSLLGHTVHRDSKRRRS